MPTKRSNSLHNRLLHSLPPLERQQVFENSETVDLQIGDILCEYNQIPRHVYFPVTGLISLVVSIDDEAPLELAMIGNEGMVGATKILGVGEAPMRGVVRIKGKAIMMSISAFSELAVQGTQLHSIVKRYLFVLMTQLNRKGGCLHFHEVSGRLADWLLLAHDRSAGYNFRLTQQVLSEILGVQRSAVSIAASALQGLGLIHYSRGDITILNRKGLEAASCSCHAAIMKDQRRFSSPAKAN